MGQVILRAGKMMQLESYTDSYSGTPWEMASMALLYPACVMNQPVA
jgi:hypothetical protein